MLRKGVDSGTKVEEGVCGGLNQISELEELVPELFASSLGRHARHCSLVHSSLGTLFVVIVVLVDPVFGEVTRLFGVLLQDCADGLGNAVSLLPMVGALEGTNDVRGEARYPNGLLLPPPILRWCCCFCS